MTDTLEQFAPYYMGRPMMPVGVGRAVSETAKLWVNGSVITYKFNGGTALQRVMFLETLQEIEVIANLIFVQSERDDADVRVGFDARLGSWSFVGTDANYASAGAATINLGWDELSTYRHECGHMIGLLHEQSNPNVTINWNKEAVYAEIGGAPNYWDHSKIDFNFFAILKRERVNFTRFDPDSVMIYDIPEKFTTDGFSVKGGDDWSVLDRLHIKSIYPRLDDAGEEIKSGERIWSNSPELLVGDSPYASEFTRPYEEDVYVVEIFDADTYIFETSGTTDTHLELYGPNSATRIVARDDNGVLDAYGNARIEVYLVPGIYLPQVRHHSYETGHYAIQVMRKWQ